MNVHSSLWLDGRGGYRLTLSKEIPLFSRLYMEGEMEYDRWEGLDYTIIGNFVITRRISLTGNYNSTNGAGFGLNLWF